MNIISDYTIFDSTKLHLANPGRLQGGSYYSKVIYDGKPLYLQTKSCDTKNGIVVTGKKTYCDLMFHMNLCGDFIDYIQQLEERIKEILLEKSDIWFNDSLDMDDIEYFFNSSFRTYKQEYQLMRTYVQSKATPLKIYDENKLIKTYDDVKSNVICIINVKGVKFTNQSVHVDIDLKQIMILDALEESVDFDTCVIQKASYKSPTETNVVTETSTIKSVDDAITMENNESTNNTEATTEVLSNDVPTNDSDVSTMEEAKQATSALETEALESENTVIDSTPQTLESIDESILEEVKDNVDASNNLVENEESQTLEESVVLEDSKTNDETEKTIIADNTNIIPTNQYDLEEIALDVSDAETIHLKKPNEVYYEIYRVAREKAKQAKKAAIIAYLEAKNIKNTYMLDSDSDSDDESLEDLENMSVQSYNDAE